MVDEKFYEEQRALYVPIVKMFNSIPLGKRVDSRWEAPEGYTLEKFEIEGIPVERLIPNDKKTNRIVFHVHGGGYVLPYFDAYRELGVLYSKLIGEGEVISVDYRVAPTDVFPAALEDAVKTYKWILGQGYSPEEIVIMGDSAGGNLALVTTLYLKDQGIALPKGVIAISPWCKLHVEAQSFTTNLNKDCILGVGGIAISSEGVNPSYIKGQDYKNPYISPIYGDFKGFPHLLIQGGSHEILLDDILETAKNAKEAGVDVNATIYEMMSHDFQLLLPELKESQKAWAEMKAFINRIFD